MLAEERELLRVLLADPAATRLIHTVLAALVAVMAGAAIGFVITLQ